jgi:Flp pilus assembly protein TadD
MMARARSLLGLGLFVAAGCTHARPPTVRIGDTEVVMRDPLGPEDRLDLGRSLGLDGDLTGAQRELALAAREAPGDPRPDRFLGDALARAGRLPEAERAYRRSLVRRETPEALNNLATALILRGERIAAARLARRALELERRDERRVHILDTLQQAEGRAN